MDNSSNIKLEKVSVKVPIFSSPKSRSFKQKILGIGALSRSSNNVIEDIQYVEALKDVSIEIKNGSRLGILGRNGAGKSTLLRVIGGILSPTLGSVEVKGRASVFINNSIYMNPEMSGREFIHIQSLIAGASIEKIYANMEDIIDFAELDYFIDLPIRTYSTGMHARLSFAVATAYEREIILIDEGLGAGDQEFQEKAKIRLDKWLEKAGIVLFCSHSKPLIDSMCNETITLDNGRIVKYD